MKRSILSIAPGLIAGLLLTGLGSGAVAADAPKRVLVVTTTTGFRHSSIQTAEKVLAKLAKESGAFTIDLVQQPPDKPVPPRKPADLKADADEAARRQHQDTLAKYQADAAKFKTASTDWEAALKQRLTQLSPENLKKYDGVIFANTTGDLPLPDPQGFVDWVKQGHGFVGVHSATDTFREVPGSFPGFKPYVEMIGGAFLSHGAQAGVDCLNEDRAHPACKELGTSWSVFDEIYLLKEFDRSKVHTLLGLDKHPNQKTPGYFPVAWGKRFGKGRVFYTSLGHREDIWDEDWTRDRKNSKEVALAYQKHLLGGIKWALGLEPGDATPQVK
jgi:type 1 glutamine amidotransferase